MTINAVRSLPYQSLLSSQHSFPSLLVQHSAIKGKSSSKFYTPTKSHIDSSGFQKKLIPFNDHQKLSIFQAFTHKLSLSKGDYNILFTDVILSPNKENEKVLLYLSSNRNLHTAFIQQLKNEDAFPIQYLEDAFYRSLQGGLYETFQLLLWCGRLNREHITSALTRCSFLNGKTVASVFNHPLVFRRLTDKDYGDMFIYYIKHGDSSYAGFSDLTKQKIIDGLESMELYDLIQLIPTTGGGMMSNWMVNLISSTHKLTRESVMQALQSRIPSQSSIYDHGVMDLLRNPIIQSLLHDSDLFTLFKSAIDTGNMGVLDVLERHISLRPILMSELSRIDSAELNSYFVKSMDKELLNAISLLVATDRINHGVITKEIERKVLYEKFDLILYVLKSVKLSEVELYQVMCKVAELNGLGLLSVEGFYSGVCKGMSLGTLLEVKAIAEKHGYPIPKELTRFIKEKNNEYRFKSMF